jgi:hypothetical protein
VTAITATSASVALVIRIPARIANGSPRGHHRLL